eukprot:GEMP01053856.1.p1 GENE.GEMP01053856.1~~GEMP01053856.1.p1  ORF type:complete len:366 (+),score=72.77 GEMP01053856.1:79-1176(+)
MDNLRETTALPFGHIPSLRDHIPLKGTDNSLRLLRGRVPVQRVPKDVRGKSWDTFHHLAFDNDFSAPQGRNYFDRPRERRPISGLQFPIKPVEVTWTNEMEMDEDMEWSRLPNPPIAMPLAIEEESSWEARHQLVKNNQFCNPALRSYFRVFEKDPIPAVEDAQTSNALPIADRRHSAAEKTYSRTPLAIAAELRLASTISNGSHLLSPDDALVLSKEAAHFRRQTDGVRLGLEYNRGAHYGDVKSEAEEGPSDWVIRAKQEKVRRFRPTTNYLRTSYSTPCKRASEQPPLSNDVAECAPHWYSRHHVTFAAQANEKVYTAQRSFFDRQRGSINWYKPRRPRRKGKSLHATWVLDREWDSSSHLE